MANQVYRRLDKAGILYLFQLRFRLEKGLTGLLGLSTLRRVGRVKLCFLSSNSQKLSLLPPQHHPAQVGCGLYCATAVLLISGEVIQGFRV